MTARHLALMAMLLALALCLHQLERLLPLPLMPYPGVKLGLGNLVTLVSLFLLSRRQALLFVVLRGSLTGFLTSISSLLFSLAGALMAFAVMCSLAYTWAGAFSLPGLSVAGAIAHNTGQLLVAAAFAGSLGVVAYLPVLLGSALISGAAIGFLARLLLTSLRASTRVAINPRLLGLL